MDGRGDQLLAGAGFAEDKDGGIGPAHLVENGEDRLHRLALADDIRGPVVAVQLLLEADIFLGEDLDLQGLVHGDQHLVEIERFGDIIEGAAAHGLHGILDGGVGRHHDHRGDRQLAQGFPQHLGPARPRQADVGDDQGKLALLQGRQRRVAIGHGQHAVPFALQRIGQRNAQDLFVFDDENALAHVASGMMKETLVPIPSWLSSSICPRYFLTSS